MPQELHVLQCFSCRTFQVQIVKKVPKWKCNVCNEKQSVKKVYAQGSGKECREYVQQLNFINGQLQDSHLNQINHQAMGQRSEDIPKVGNNQVYNADSKWDEFLDNSNNKQSSLSEDENEDKVETATIRNQVTAPEWVLRNASPQPECINFQFQNNGIFPKEVVFNNEMTRISKRKSSDLLELNNHDKPFKKSNVGVNCNLQDASDILSLSNKGYTSKSLKKEKDSNQCNKMDFIKEKASKWEQFLDKDKTTDFLDPLVSKNVSKQEPDLRGLSGNQYCMGRNEGSLDLFSASATSNSCSRKTMKLCSESSRNVTTQIKQKKTLASLFDDEIDVNLDNLLDL